MCDVAAGRVAICPEISEAVARSHLQDDASAIDTPFPRELEILRMLLDGRSAEENSRRIQSQSENRLELPLRHQIEAQRFLRC